jgi:hypothetical protein
MTRSMMKRSSSPRFEATFFCFPLQVLSTAYTHVFPLGHTSGYSLVGDTAPSSLPEPLDREILEQVNDQLKQEQAEGARAQICLASPSQLGPRQDRRVVGIVRTIAVAVLRGEKVFAVGAAPVHVGHIVVIAQTCARPVDSGIAS